MKRVRTFAKEILGIEDARRLQGSGWEGDLAQMRAHREIPKLRRKLRWKGSLDKSQRNG